MATDLLRRCPPQHVDDAFDIDRANPKIALTRLKGVFEPPVKDGVANPARHIRLGLGFFAPNVTPATNEATATAHTTSLRTAGLMSGTRSRRYQSAMTSITIPNALLTHSSHIPDFGSETENVPTSQKSRPRPVA